MLPQETSDNQEDLLMVECDSDDSQVRVFQTTVDKLPDDPDAKVEFLDRQRVKENMIHWLVGPSFRPLIELRDIDDGPFEIEIMHIRRPNPPV